VAGLPSSPLIREALTVASGAHAGQIRNGAGGIPYVEHPVAVAELLAEHGWEEEVLAAALLHDVVEDSELTLDDLSERFDRPVVDLVAALSDDESIAEWEARKDEHRERVGRAGPRALAIYGADKLTNVRALRGAYESEGEGVEDELKVSLDAKLAAWEADHALLCERAPELRYLDELSRELQLMNECRAQAGRDPQRR
jgi:(p)ppGpp synthase/HD superfamily hydrolase